MTVAEKLPNRVSIDVRPEIVDQRERLGDWEIDTIIGQGQQNALLSLTERKSRLALLRKIDRRTAQAVKLASLHLLDPLDGPVHTITADNGKEFAHHELIAQHLQAVFLLRPSICSLGTRGQRKHEWPRSPVLPERHRFFIRQRRRSRFSDPKAQYASEKKP